MRAEPPDTEAGRENSAVRVRSVVACNWTQRERITRHALELSEYVLLFPLY